MTLRLHCGNNRGSGGGEGWRKGGGSISANEVAAARALTVINCKVVDGDRGHCVVKREALMCRHKGQRQRKDIVA